MDIYIKNKDGVTLFTEKKYCEENIQVIPETEKIKITPKLEEQKFISEKIGYDEVTVERVTADIDPNIKSENIKVGTTILGIEGGYEGIDTSDATVNPNQILEGQTAYANGQKIEGTMPNNGALSFSPSDEEQNIPTGYIEGAKVEATDITKLNEYDACLTLANSIETTEDYTDTTATAEDIKEGKVAYSNGERIVGTAQINDLTITNGAYLFYNGNRQNMLKEILFLCKKITTMENMFYTCRALTEVEIVEINKLDTSEVTSMKGTFSTCSALKNIVLTNFNTSKVKTMYDMFRNCTKVTNINLSSFDTSNVTEMENMFNSCTVLTDLDLSNFDMSKVIEIYNMFYGCKNLTNLNSFENLGKGYVEKSSNYYNYTLNLSACTNLTHNSLMSVINNLYDLNLTYDVANGGTLYTQSLNLGATNLEKLSAEEIAIATNKGWTIS